MKKINLKYRISRFSSNLSGILASFGRVLLFLGTVVLFSGCGYTTRSAISKEYKTLVVKNFVNKVEIQTATPEYKTYYPGLETKITNAVVSRFIYDGNLHIAKEEDADLILEGELLDYMKQALRYTESDNVEEYRISVVVNIALKDKEGNVIWQRSNFTGDTTYRLSGPLAKTEATALEDAVSDLARRIVNLTVESW
ncbi:MAG: LptE family protein [Candidatus Omnitrophica bacterium]|nr:LptE family protein [Candidatus Omnitrophota bacterium]